ncbi:hypothetical protein ANANG_G00218300 [Anguilla anguilla]|uniref:RRM domain-containing protein n=1 Tax=Anguilla anguilla TaxID=7936 RepID=A0A9D3RSE4_ANGAN|nr:hypothetical protein ANANG_G00218300 [Anguilla anguilla]
MPVEMGDPAMHRDCPLDCKVYVGNLGNNGNKTELERSFGYYGPLRSVWVARNPRLRLRGVRRPPRRHGRREGAGRENSVWMPCEGGAVERRETISEPGTTTLLEPPPTRRLPPSKPRRSPQSHHHASPHHPLNHRVGGASVAVAAGPSPETGGGSGLCLGTGTTNPRAPSPGPETTTH